MSNLTKKSSFVDKLIDDLFNVDWKSLKFSDLYDNLYLPTKTDGFQEIDGEYVMETDFGANAKDSNIKVNVDENDGMNVIEVSSDYEWSNENNSRKNSTYFSTTLPNDADTSTVNAKLSKDGKLKITVQKTNVVETECEQEEKTIKVTKTKKN